MENTLVSLANNKCANVKWKYCISDTDIKVLANALLNNNSLGFAPLINTTLYVKYRVGGGSETNIGAGVINNFGSINIKKINKNY